MTQTPTALECIEIERACERIVYAYARALDLGDMSAAADFFAEQGSLARPMAPDQIITGRENIRASLLTRPKTLRTMHLATNVTIDVLDRDAAPPFMSAGPVYFGEFRDRFVRERSQWRFLERRGSIQMKFALAPAP
jgi:hypothetical protein